MEGNLIYFTCALIFLAWLPVNTLCDVSAATLEQLKICALLCARKELTYKEQLGYFPGAVECATDVTNDRSLVLYCACQYLHFYATANCTFHSGVSRKRRYSWFASLTIVNVFKFIDTLHCKMYLILRSGIHTTFTVNGYMHVKKSIWCTIYLQFIPSLYLYMFRAC
jgi:hypothetical protein